ncbi:MAG: ABC transporter ATP-binding protein [Methylococcaceae bacterium]|jgi:ABC-2 type transport system ATP-binding protein
MDFAIDVKGINKLFGDKHVVRDLALQVRQGEVFGFLGPNGSGKTTSIRLLCGLLTPDSGSGQCLGYNVLTQSKEIKRQVGYMTQKFSLWEDLTIAENLDFIARMFGIKQRKLAVSKTLEELGLSGRQKQLAGTLSGGWKQRLALASCLMHKPKLLLLDEPSAGVDPKARRDFWEQLHLLSTQGITILVSTHYMDEAERCHRLAYIAYGSILAAGSPEEVVKQQNICTWAVSGDNIQPYSTILRELPGVEQVATFGAVLHVSSAADADPSAQISQFASKHGLQVQQVPPTLEDVFIHLMQHSQDPLAG